MRRRRFVAALAATTGGFVSLSSGAVAGVKDSLGVTIYDTSSPVTGGEELAVFVLAENDASYAVSDTLELYDPSTELLDSRAVTVPGETTDIVGLRYDTSETGSETTFPLTVTSSGDADSTQVTVEATDREGLSVRIAETSTPIDAGERLTVTVRVKNDASRRVRDTVELLESGDEVLDSREVTLEAGGAERVELGYEASPVDRATVALTVESTVDSDSEDVTLDGNESDSDSEDVTLDGNESDSGTENVTLDGNESESDPENASSDGNETDTDSENGAVDGNETG